MQTMTSTKEITLTWSPMDEEGTLWVRLYGSYHLIVRPDADLLLDTDGEWLRWRFDVFHPEAWSSSGEVEKSSSDYMGFAPTRDICMKLACALAKTMSEEDFLLPLKDLSSVDGQKVISKVQKDWAANNDMASELLNAEGMPGLFDDEDEDEDDYHSILHLKGPKKTDLPS